MTRSTGGRKRKAKAKAKAEPPAKKKKKDEGESEEEPAGEEEEEEEVEDEEELVSTQAPTQTMAAFNKEIKETAQKKVANGTLGPAKKRK
jgi:hypothetical protein